MERDSLLNLLAEYSLHHRNEFGTCQAFTDFVRLHENCFSRDLLKGHVTGSAWIINEDSQKCLLIHHRKLGRWLQPGGHADGCTDIEEVARKEAEEETGLKKLTLLTSRIFDLDIHPIPARGNTPGHDHYDVRFIYRASTEEPLADSPETNDIAWWTLNEAAALVAENDSILRMIEKTRTSF